MSTGGADRARDTISILLAAVVLMGLGGFVAFPLGWALHQRVSAGDAGAERRAYYRALWEYCVLGEQSQGTPLGTATWKCGQFIVEAADAGLYESPIEGYEPP